MPLLSLELRYLRYFVAVAEELNFTRAAERLHVTASALSMQIKKLEELLDVRLFERNTAKVSLTGDGELLMVKARDILRNAREMLDSLRGRLRIGLPGGLFYHMLIPETLKIYHERFPKVEVALFEMDINDGQFQAVAEGRIHIGFMYDPRRVRLDAIEHLTVIDMPLCAVMGDQHPLASKKEVTMSEVAAYPLLTIEQYEPQTQRLLKLFRRKKLELTILQRTTSFNACYAMLAANLGIALMAENFVMTHNPRLAMRPIKDRYLDLRQRLHAVWKKESPAHVRHFIELLGQTAGAEGRRLAECKPVA